MTRLSEAERQATEAVRLALQALHKAREACDRAEFGSQVVQPLYAAYKDARYALDTIEGRT